MDEPSVVRRVHRFLKAERIGGLPVVRLFTDAHGTLLAHNDLAPFQRFTIDFGDFVMHPDIVAQLGDGESLLAVEAKGEKNLLPGLFKAEMYQAGVQKVFLAASANCIGKGLIDMARRKDVGLIAVGEDVKLLFVPEARMPLHDHYRFLMRQIDSVVSVTEGGTFQYNIPTHYLVWSIVLDSSRDYDVNSLRSILGDYPLPKNTNATLKGAQRLGIVKLDGRKARLTDIGGAVKHMLPPDVDEWSRIHSRISSRGSQDSLCNVHPTAAAVLRLLLLQDSVVRIVIEGLRSFPKPTASFAELAIACDRIDHAKAPIFFLKPESAARLSDRHGRIPWESVNADDYRSTTFYQYKSILKHAGILALGRLGGATVVGYDPFRDIWALAKDM
jgi:hypothetical protein